MLYDELWSRISREPWLTTVLLSFLLLGNLFLGGPGEPGAELFALQADQPYAVPLYWLFHIDWPHLWVNLLFLTAVGGFLELAGGRRRLLLVLAVGLLGGGLLYWLGSRMSPEIFTPAVGASMGGFALAAPAFYSLLKVFHAGVLLRARPALGGGLSEDAGWTGPLYGLAILLATVVGLLALAVGVAAGNGAGAGHLLGYALGCLLAAEFWWRDFMGAGQG